MERAVEIGQREVGRLHVVERGAATVPGGTDGDEAGVVVGRDGPIEECGHLAEIDLSVVLSAPRSVTITHCSSWQSPSGLSVQPEELGQGVGVDEWAVSISAIGASVIASVIRRPYSTSVDARYS